MKEEKGITIIVLTITVIIMLIILSIAVSSGTDSAKTAQLQAFIADCETIQGQVDIIYEKIKLNENYIEETFDEDFPPENENGDRTFNKDNIEKYLDISNLTQELTATINFKTGEVTIKSNNTISDNEGIKYYWYNGQITELTE